MNWDDLRVFLAVARTRSLTAAAHQLGVSQSTVSRRMGEMERGLDARLIRRGTDGHALTNAGANLFETAARVEAEIAGVDTRVAGRNATVSGRLRVTCTDNFLNSYLAPHLARFTREHPNIDLDVITGYRHLSLARQEADVAIRTIADPPETLIERRLFRFALAVYGARAFVDALDGAPDPADLAWIGWDNEAYNRMMITAHFPAARVRHRVDSLLDMRSLARAGLGVAVIGCFAGDSDPDLARVYPGTLDSQSMDLWVLAHPDMWRTARARGFVRFIAARFTADRDLFAGERVDRAPTEPPVQRFSVDR